MIFTKAFKAMMLVQVLLPVVYSAGHHFFSSEGIKNPFQHMLSFLLDTMYVKLNDILERQVKILFQMIENSHEN